MKAFEIGAKDTVVFYLHGLRSHGRAQQAALQHIVRNVGVSAVSLEMPGHGVDSVEDHCMVPQYRQLVAQIKDEIQSRTINTEQVILMGYSFGGALMLLAAESLVNDPEFSPKVAGFIGISTAFYVGHNVARWQVGLVNVIAPLSRFLFRNFRNVSSIVTIGEMNVDLISADVTVRKAINDDELVYKGRIPLNTSAQVYKAGLAARKTLDRVDLPVLLLHSKDDGIALAPRPENMPPHVNLRLFNTLRHNCIDGLSREVIVARKAITKFIADRR